MTDVFREPRFRLKSRVLCISFWGKPGSMCLAIPSNRSRHKGRNYWKNIGRFVILRRSNRPALIAVGRCLKKRALPAIYSTGKVVRSGPI